jgi:Tol biopolymer transport system component
VAFASSAWDLVPGAVDQNRNSDVFLLDRNSGAVTLVSRAATASLAASNGGSTPTAISSDGEWLLFESTSTNLVPGVLDPDAFGYDVFLFQRSTGNVTLVSKAIGPELRVGNGQSTAAGMSADGRWIVFNSNANDLVAGVTDGNGATDMFLYQRDAGTVTLLSRTASAPSTAASVGGLAVSISADGDWILFKSRSTDLLGGLVLPGGHDGLFLHQRSTGAVRLVSRSVGSPLVGADNYASPRGISADGEIVLFGSPASNLLSGVATQVG